MDNDTPPEPTWPAFSRTESGAIEVLDLDNPRRGVLVRIRGTECYLRRPGTLAPRDARQLVRFSHRIDELIGIREELTADQDKELKQLPDKMTRLILDAPEKILRALDDEARMTLIAAFLDSSAR